MPTDLDVLRARIRTLGVQEYSLVFEQRSQSPSAHVAVAVQAVMAAAVTHTVGDPLDERDSWKEWAVYDVGGSRTQVSGSASFSISLFRARRISVDVGMLRGYKAQVCGFV